MTSVSTEVSIEYDYAYSQETFTIEHLHIVKVVLPGNMWGIHQIPRKYTVFTHINEDLENYKNVCFTTSCMQNVKLIKKSVYFPIVKSLEDLQNLLQNVHNLVICIENTYDGKRPKECLVNLPIYKKIKRCNK